MLVSLIITHLIIHVKSNLDIARLNPYQDSQNGNDNTIAHNRSLEYHSWHPKEYLKYQITKKYLLIPAAFKHYIIRMTSNSVDIEPYSLVEEYFNSTYNTNVNFLKEFEFELTPTTDSGALDEFYIINNDRYLSLSHENLLGNNIWIANPASTKDHFSNWKILPEEESFFRFKNDDLCLTVSQYVSPQSLRLIAEKCRGDVNELFFIASIFLQRERVGFFENKDTLLPSLKQKLLPVREIEDLGPFTIKDDPFNLNAAERIIQRYTEYDKITSKQMILNKSRNVYDPERENKEFLLKTENF